MITNKQKKEMAVGSILTTYAQVHQYLQNLQAATDSDNQDLLEGLRSFGNQIMQRVNKSFELENHEYLPFQLYTTAAVNEILDNSATILTEATTLTSERIIQSLLNIDQPYPPPIEHIEGRFIFIGDPHIHNVFITEVNRADGQITIVDCYQEYAGVIKRRRHQALIGQVLN